ncbi:hypothetical protein QC762_0042850 [Podospora pseudocomata]|uniref:Subtilisin-like serine protease n=1 Tax=Podospora pseudocomata TaxID=2093779 RepID=A0ABR0GNA8_9PEZI|nr:hypothetical protein QC762_0042850 [Podospora pseudocomata]
MSPPFSAFLLEVQPGPGGDLLRPQDRLLSLLPASYRTDTDDIVAAGRDVCACIAKELDLKRLDRVLSWLWVAGRPMPPRPLHRQLLLSRELFVTEQMDMHLVWTSGRLFVKPIPRFLLDPAFWMEYLCCQSGCSCSVASECNRPALQRRALGFLFSYAALISHESDFSIAQDKHLLPPEVTWLAWRHLVEQLDTERIYSKVDVRFHYGELRLSRLNKIYLLSQRPFLLHRYMSHWQQYWAFFQDNFAWLASATIYITIALTAMQVGLATRTLADNDAFQSVSYGFTVFSILGPIAAVGLIVLVFCYMFIHNWAATVAYGKKRQQHIASSSESP